MIPFLFSNIFEKEKKRNNDKNKTRTWKHRSATVIKLDDGSSK